MKDEWVNKKIWDKLNQPTKNWIEMLWHEGKKDEVFSYIYYRINNPDIK